MLVTSCKPDDLRAMATDSITISFDGETCLPLESFIPQGQSVNLKLVNNSDYEFSWFFIIFPLKEEFNPDELANIYFSENVQAHQTIDTVFKAPMLPARYDTLCMVDNDPAKVTLKYILVVEPYPTTNN
jgi:hypothetical protein